MRHFIMMLAASAAVAACTPALAQGAQGVGTIDKTLVPTAMQMGAQDPAGKLKAAKLDANGNLLTSAVPSQAAAVSTPLAGSSATTQTVGPFTPQLGRPINLRLSGTWAGSAQILRSIDAGTTKTSLTIGGSPWGSYMANANEPVWTETEAGATYYLVLTVSSGTVVYRLAQ